MHPKLSVVARLFGIVFVVGIELPNKESFFNVSEEENLILWSWHTRSLLLYLFDLIQLSQITSRYSSHFDVIEMCLEIYKKPWKNLSNRVDRLRNGNKKPNRDKNGKDWQISSDKLGKFKFCFSKWTHSKVPLKYLPARLPWVNPSWTFIASKKSSRSAIFFLWLLSSISTLKNPTQ